MEKAHVPAFIDAGRAGKSGDPADLPGNVAGADSDRRRMNPTGFPRVGVMTSA